MSMPMVLDETLNNRVARLQKQIEEEAEEKAKEKLRRSKIGFPDIVCFLKSFCIPVCPFCLQKNIFTFCKVKSHKGARRLMDPLLKKK